MIIIVKTLGPLPLGKWVASFSPHPSPVRGEPLPLHNQSPSPERLTHFPEVFKIVAEPGFKPVTLTPDGTSDSGGVDAPPADQDGSIVKHFPGAFVCTQCAHRI